MKIDQASITAQISESVRETTSSSGTDFNAIFEAAKASGDNDELREVSNQLEAVFINMLMKTMRDTIPESEGIFEKSESEKMFQGMLDEEYSTHLSEAGGIGISDMIFDQFQKYLYNDEDKAVSSFEMKG